MQEEQIGEALNRHWHASAAGDANAEHDITMTMPFAIILSQANESSGEAICRPCGVSIQASRRISTSNEFSEKVISGSPNIQSPKRGDQHTE
jgi:hypothetical protein